MMGRLFVVLLSLLVCSTALAAEEQLAGEEVFVRQIVASLIERQPTPGFAVADKVVALDNGETLSRDDFQKAWPEFCKMAFREKVSADAFFAKMDLRMEPATGNKRLMNNKRVLAAYKLQQGDVYCDASRAKNGEKQAIGYPKAFIYVIRKVEGKWTLIGIGG
jgi:hypothetical protein